MIIPDGEAGLSTAVSQMVGGIMSYVRWPAPAGADGRRLCVVGQPRLTARIVPGPRLSVARVPARTVLSGASCDALYLGTISTADRQSLVVWLRGRAVLTLTDDDPDCLHGAMFCLKPEAGGLRYTVNLDAIARGGIQVDPRVLQMGRKPGGQQ